MATIHKQFEIGAPIEQVWAKMSDLSAVHGLFNMLEDAAVEDDIRTCHIHGGGELKELIITVDIELKRIAYSIIDSPFDMIFHSASWQVIPTGDNTIFEWYTDVKPDEIAPILEEIMDAEKVNIIRGLSAS